MDIYIGLDCSGSLSDADYAKEKNDTLAFIRQLPVNPNGTWVGVRPFRYARFLMAILSSSSPSSS